MTATRNLFATSALAACLALASGGSVAWADSALSGYGGPGGGVQALLGSTLAGGAGGGGSRGGGSGNNGGSSRPGSTAGRPAGTGPSGNEVARTATGVPARSGTGANRGARTKTTPTSTTGLDDSRGASTTRSTDAGGASESSARTYQNTSSTNGLASVGSQTLGLSGSDIVLILIAIAGITAIGGLTRQLARTQP